MGGDYHRSLISACLLFAIKFKDFSDTLGECLRRLLSLKLIWTCSGKKLHHVTIAQSLDDVTTNQN